MSWRHHKLENRPLTPLKFAQIGTRHGHAQGKWLAQSSSQDVEAVGIWEPDLLSRETARHRAGFAGARWFESAEEVLGSGAFDPRSFAASWAAEQMASPDCNAPVEVSA